MERISSSFGTPRDTYEVLEPVTGAGVAVALLVGVGVAVLVVVFVAVVVPLCFKKFELFWEDEA